MALHELSFRFTPAQPRATLPPGTSHTGVVGSGDLEILLTAADLGGAVTAAVTTPVGGFEPVWEKVLNRFVQENGLHNVAIEINDNNATPFVVSTRLRQALMEAGEELQS